MDMEVLRQRVNVQHLSGDEMSAILKQICLLDAEGDYQEVRVLQNRLPLLPSVAQDLKQTVGIDKLVTDGCNLSLAVDEYGYEWLYN